MFKFLYNLFKKKESVYCQECNVNITKEGGYVTSDGDIYCVHESINLFLPRSMKDSHFLVDYKNSREVQQSIKEGKLTHFGRLESSVNNN